MGGFRGSDDVLDKEIAALERIGRLRLRRYTQDLGEVGRELAALKRERARRHASSEVSATAAVAAEGSAEV
ncbi:MAG: hypothetical protein L3J93_02175 [Thermoplasmata archaeon]|nr:hypothetical protein [Thermoplasmata archaeon]